MPDNPQLPASSKRPKVSAFASAHQDVNVTAEITVEDVISLTQWHRAQAVAFLRQHGDQIGEAMVAAGLVTLQALIERKSNVN